jgi:hypothetical protein
VVESSFQEGIDQSKTPVSGRAPLGVGVRLNGVATLLPSKFLKRITRIAVPVDSSNAVGSNNYLMIKRHFEADRGFRVVRERKPARFGNLSGRAKSLALSVYMR